MASVDECLQQASDCVRHAEECADEADQAVFMLMAKSWMRLAVQIDEVHPSPSVFAESEEQPRGDEEDAAGQAQETASDDAGNLVLGSQIVRG